MVFIKLSVSKYILKPALLFWALSKQSHVLKTLMEEPSENTVGKGENAVTSIFSFYHIIFYHFEQEESCRLATI